MVFFVFKKRRKKKKLLNSSSFTFANYLQSFFSLVLWTVDIIFNSSYIFAIQKKNENK